MSDNERRELNQIFYHSQTSEANALVHQLDELTIQNMISSLNNPTIFATMTAEEKTLLAQTIRNHTVMKAGLILAIQEEKMKSNSRGL